MCQLSEKLAKGHDRLSRRRFSPWQRWRGDPSPPDRLGKLGIGKQGTPPLPGWTELRNDTVPIGHEHGLPAGYEANVFTQLVLEDF